MIVRFETVRADFPPNLVNLTIRQVLLSFGRSPGRSLQVTLNFATIGDQRVGGTAITNDGVISPGIGNDSAWRSMQNKAPIGVWELALPDIPEMRSLFKNEEIEDILFVITYSGQTPEWPA
jgi:hypothetical protein